MKHTIQLSALACLLAFSLWRAYNQGDTMTQVTAAFVALIFFLALKQVWKERK